MNLVDLEEIIENKNNRAAASENTMKKKIKFNNIHYEGTLFNSIAVEYSTNTDDLIIEGRFVNSKKLFNRIYNYDDYLIYRREKQGNEIVESSSIDSIIDNVNRELNKLVGMDIYCEIYPHKSLLDIRNFQISNIEICFNLWLEDDYVEEYLYLFNKKYDHNLSRGKNKSHKNFAIDKARPYTESFYIKTLSDVKDRKNRSSNVNFYNKKNQILKRSIDTDINHPRRLIIRPEERFLVENLLRLEVQLYYHELYRIIGKAKYRKFKYLLDLGLCYNILLKKYERFIGGADLDFYSYKSAKNKIENEQLLNNRDKKNLLNSIMERTKYNKWCSETTERKYNKMLHSLGIHEIFIPTKFNIDFLESPMKLLRKKLENYLLDPVDTKYFKIDI